MPSAFLTSPIVQLVMLAAASALVRLLVRGGPVSTAAPAGVMAVGIFELGALGHMSFPGRTVAGQLITLELLIITAYLVGAYAVSFFQGTFRRHTADPVDCFAIGTWVAALVVVARLVTAYLPADWDPLAWVLGILALAVWLGYAWLTMRSYRILLTTEAARHVTGRILLSTVSVQSLVILGAALLPGQVPWWLDAALMAYGYALYALGASLIARRYLALNGWSLAEHWDNTNCILHGAMSITGLAAVLSGTLSDGVIVATWIWAAAMLVVVEGVEVARAWARVRAYGWQRGVMTYHVSQWARNFTFGMFYAFTLALDSDLSAHATGLGWLEPIHLAIVSWGQYVVLLALLFEMVLFLWHNSAWRGVRRQAVEAHAIGERR